ncbi:hypothetical protein V8E36_005324 [Tilletia maclaganii]
MGGTASQKKEADAALWLWQHAVRLCHGQRMQGSREPLATGGYPVRPLRK